MREGTCQVEQANEEKRKGELLKIAWKHAKKKKRTVILRWFPDGSE
jgi:hypothetical protein